MSAPPLSITLTGISRSPESEPLAVFFLDTARPETFDHFTVAERGAFRALAATILDALDEVLP